MLCAMLKAACFAVAYSVVQRADALCPDQNANHISADDLFVVQENLSRTLAISLLTLLKFLHMPTDVVHDLLLQALNSLDLVDFGLLEELEVLIDESSNDLPQSCMFISWVCNHYPASFI